MICYGDFLICLCRSAQNPDNFFNENEQLAFCPALIVPGALACVQPASHD